MNKLDCIIDCTTLKCERCSNPASSCRIKRNCQPWKKNNEYAPLPNGPGTELKKILSKFGIEATAECSCSSKARHMDYMEQIEPGWAKNNIETIIDWLEEEAKKRNTPFLRLGAKILVKRAIKNSYKKTNKTE